MVLFSDNFVAIQSIKGIYRNVSSHALKIHQIRQFLLHKWPFIPEMYWIKGHAGHEGNEMADRLAEKAREASQRKYLHLSIELANKEHVHHVRDLNEELSKYWYTKWKQNDKYYDLKALLPSFKEVIHLNKVLYYLSSNEIRIITHLITDYNHLNYHKSKTTDKLTPWCTCGTGLETVNHFLLKCTLHDEPRHHLLITLKNIFKNHYETWFLPTFDHLLQNPTLELLLVASRQPITVAKQILKATCHYVIKTGRIV